MAVCSTNAAEFGLAAYCYTQNLARTFCVSQALQAGMIGINESLITTEVVLFGGVIDSGRGREGSVHGIEELLPLNYLSLGGL